MADTMMQLGEFQFSIDTAAFQKFQRQSNFHWQSQSRFGQGPAVQNTGWDAEKITLQGVIYPGYRGGLGQLDAMRAQAQKGEPLTLINGAGYILGEYVITDVTEDQSEFARAGLAQKVDFSLHLLRYDNDAESVEMFKQSSGMQAQAAATKYVPDPTPGVVHDPKSQTYITRDGDTLERIANQYYGMLKGRVVERLYGVNYGLADIGSALPPGLKLVLPPLPAIVSVTQLPKLWG